MRHKIREIIISDKYDKKLSKIQNIAISIMIACILTFFIAKKLVPQFIKIHIGIFIIALFIALVIGLFWFLKEFIPFRDKELEKFYLEHPELKKDKK